MKYSLTLTIDDPDAGKLLMPDAKDFSKSRSKLNITANKQTIVKIEAQDAVALRATTDSIMQLLKVYEKLKWTNKQNR